MDLQSRDFLCGGTASPQDMGFNVKQLSGTPLAAGATRYDRRRFKKLVERAGDRCTLCRKPFVTATYTGKRGGRDEYVGACCVDRLDLIDGVGFFIPEEPAHKRDDREWFAAHPTRSHRLRRAMVDEGWEGWVIVRQIEPGTRHRVLFTSDLDLPDDEMLAHTLFDMLFEARAAGRTGFPASLISAVGRDAGWGKGMIAVAERAAAAKQRAEDLAIAVDIVLRSVPAIDDLVTLLEAGGGSVRLVRALKAELAARRRRR